MADGLNRYAAGVDTPIAVTAVNTAVSWDATFSHPVSGTSDAAADARVADSAVTTIIVENLGANPMDYEVYIRGENTSICEVVAAATVAAGAVGCSTITDVAKYIQVYVVSALTTTAVFDLEAR